MDVKSKMQMWSVSFYERSHHTNPGITAYVRAFERPAAVRASLDVISTFTGYAHFDKVLVDTAEWKQEEEVCTPWNRVELP
jgi:hypothetical protein